MRFLCLICAETVMEQMPEAVAEKHFEDYREFTENIRESGHLVACNRLLEVAARIPGARIGCVELRPVAEDAQTLHALGAVAPGALR